MARRDADSGSCCSKFLIGDVPADYPWTQSFRQVPEPVRKEMSVHLDNCGGTSLPWKRLAQYIGISPLDTTCIESTSKRTGHGPSQYVFEQYCQKPGNNIRHMVEVLKGLKLLDAATCLINHCEGISGTRGQVGISYHSLKGQQECTRHTCNVMDVDGDEHEHGRGCQSLPTPNQFGGQGHRHVQFGGNPQQPANHGMSPAVPPPPDPQTMTPGLKQEPFFDQRPQCTHVNAWSTSAVGEDMDATSVYQATSMDTEDHKPELPLPLIEGMARGVRGVASVNDVAPGSFPWGAIYPNQCGDPEADLPYHASPQFPPQTPRGTPHSGALDLRTNPPGYDPLMPDPGRIEIKKEPTSFGYPEDEQQQHVHVHIKKEEQQQLPCSHRTIPTTDFAYNDPGYSSSSIPSGQSFGSFRSTDSGIPSVDGLHARHIPIKGGSNTFPRDNKDKTTPSVVVKNSQSAFASLELAPFGKGRRDVRIFLTYSYDNRSHMKKVIDLYQSLRKNGFSVTLDETERSLVPAGESQQMLKARYSKCHFVLVCVSPKYYEDVTRPQRAVTDVAKEDYRLNAQFIYSLMEEELEGGNKRVIPIIFEQSGAKKHHLPPLLASMFKYRWPDQYKHLFYHLMEPEKVLQKILTKRPGSVNVENFPGTTGSYLSPGPLGTHYSG